eukprot:COSAG06_NODE_423_length_15942_cov_7.276463_14_plen_356_part_00
MPQIVVTLLPSGRQVSPDVEQSDTVEAVRRKIDALAGDARSAPPELQLLVFGATVLEDGHTVEEYGIAKESDLRRSWPTPVWCSLNVGGVGFTVPLDTLLAVPGSRLSVMFEPMRQGAAPVEAAAAAGAVAEGVPYEEALPLLQDGHGAYLLDRDGATFRYVISFLRLRRPVYRNGRRVEPEAAVDPADALRAELATLKIGGLNMRLRELGVDAATIDSAADVDDPKAALVALIVDRTPIVEPEPEPELEEHDEAVTMLLPDSSAELRRLIVEAKHLGLAELAECAEALLQKTQGGGVPAGMISQWAGSVDTIPEGWALCDGENGTPDLRDKFVVAAGVKFAVSATNRFEPRQLP